MDWYMANEIMSDVVGYLNSIGIDTRTMTDKQLEDLALIIHHNGETWIQSLQKWATMTPAG